jgi:hypothetical protein
MKKMTVENPTRKLVRYLWPIYFPVGCLIYIYLGIGDYLYKLQRSLLDKIIKKVTEV